MKAINRLESEWTPSWDLGLQDEFGFVAEAQIQAAPAQKVTRGWSVATKAVLNRQAMMDRRLGQEPSSVGALIAYFEALCDEEER